MKMLDGERVSGRLLRGWIQTAGPDAAESVLLGSKVEEGAARSPIWISLQALAFRHGDPFVGWRRPVLVDCSDPDPIGARRVVSRMEGHPPAIAGELPGRQDRIRALPGGQFHLCMLDGVEHRQILQLHRLVGRPGAVEGNAHYRAAPFTQLLNGAACPRYGEKIVL